MLGGDVSGDAEDHQLAAAGRHQQDRKQKVAEQKGSVRLRMKGLSAQADSRGLVVSVSGRFRA